MINIKKLTKFLRSIALLVLGAALVSCGTYGFMGLDLDGEFVLDHHIRRVDSNQGGLPYVVTAQAMPTMFEPALYSCKNKGGRSARSLVGSATGSSLEETKQRALRECASNRSRVCLVTFVNGEDICDEELVSFTANMPAIRAEYRRQLERGRAETQRRVAQAEQQRERQATSAIRGRCKSFGFVENTPEIANCILQLTVAQEGGQATASQTTSNSGAAALERQRSLNNAIQLLNQGLNILNGPAPTSNIPTSVSCRRMGDRSGQVYTFSRIGCPVGYAPAL